MAKPNTLKSILAALSPNPPTALLELAERLQDVTLSETDAIKVYLFAQRLVEKHNLDIEFPEDEDDPQERLTELCASIVQERSKLLDAAVSSEVEGLISEYETKGKSPQDFGFARLDKTEKESIHGHLKKIRLIIEESDLDRRKKSALFERLNALSAEVDKDGTKTDAFFAFAGDLAFVSGIMAKRAKPAIAEFKEILKIVLRSRAKEEQTPLPRPQDIFLLSDESDDR